MDVKLRHFLLLLLDDLSDLDRCRLHFVLGTNVPRRLRELNNIEDTIRVFEHLIETEKIFSSLIEALYACGKSDWGKKLKDFEERSSKAMIQPVQHAQTRHTLTGLLLDEISDDEEDSGVD